MGRRELSSFRLRQWDLGGSRLRRVCRLQSRIDKLGGSRLRWRDHGVSRPVLRKFDCSNL